MLYAGHTGRDESILQDWLLAVESEKQAYPWPGDGIRQEKHPPHDMDQWSDATLIYVFVCVLLQTQKNVTNASRTGALCTPCTILWHSVCLRSEARRTSAGLMRDIADS